MPIRITSSLRERNVNNLHRLKIPKRLKHNRRWVTHAIPKKHKQGVGEPGFSPYLKRVDAVLEKERSGEEAQLAQDE